MIFKALQLNIDVKDSIFNEVYPFHIKELAQRHWTPVAVAKIAAQYLAEGDCKKVLDIGAGAGKFCLVGAACTDAMFYGVEQRESLTKLSIDIAKKHHIHNVQFIHANINQISFSDYDAFYFYNSFYENLDSSCPIDNLIPTNKDLYYSYTEYLRAEFEKTPIGTRIVTYWSGFDEIPDSFDLVASACNGFLNFWRKRNQ